MPPDPPSTGMLCMPVCFTDYECNYLTSPTSTMVTDLVVPPPFQKSRSAPEQVIYAGAYMRLSSF